MQQRNSSFTLLYSVVLLLFALAFILSFAFSFLHQWNVDNWPDYSLYPSGDLISYVSAVNSSYADGLPNNVYDDNIVSTAALHFQVTRTRENEKQRERGSEEGEQREIERVRKEIRTSGRANGDEY